MILQTVHDAPTAWLDTFAKGLDILSAGFSRRASRGRPFLLVAHTLLEVVVTAIGNILLMIQQTIHGCLRIALRLAAVFLNIGPTRTISLLGLAG
jgi:hypothetical protein